MNTLALNALLGVVALSVVLTIWLVVHLAARKRMGERHMSCKGPVIEADGNARCCQGDKDCEHA